MTITDQLRKAIAAHTPHWELQREMAGKCGLTPSTLSRFLSGKGGLSLQAVDRIATYLGLTLVKGQESADQE